MKNAASEIKHLSENEAIAKFQELVKHESTCLFTTRLTSIPLTTRPMAIQEVSDNGHFWFLSANDSDKNREIATDPRVQLFISNTSNYEFLSLYGYASASRDQQRIDELWNDIAKAWFPKGKDDPRISVIEFQPEQGFYWDTKSGKLVSLIKIAASALTGKTFQEGVEGKISL